MTTSTYTRHGAITLLIIGFTMISCVINMPIPGIDTARRTGTTPLTYRRLMFSNRLVRFRSRACVRIPSSFVLVLRMLRR